MSLKNLLWRENNQKLSAYIYSTIYADKCADWSLLSWY